MDSTSLKVIPHVRHVASFFSPLCLSARLTLHGLGVLAIAASLNACGAANVELKSPEGGTLAIPEKISDDNVGDTQRMYHRLTLDHPARTTMRNRLVEYYAAQASARQKANDYDGVLVEFQKISELLSPIDFAENRIPAQLGDIASYVVEEGMKLSDEGVVLAAYLVLSSLEKEGATTEYKELVDWGRDVRKTLKNPLEKYSQLIEVWKTHANLTPSPTVLQTLAQLHVERRDSLIHAFSVNEGMLSRQASMGAQALRIAPMDVAAVYLQHGQLASAITHVTAMETSGDNGRRLLSVLEDAKGDDEQAADALIELAEAFRSVRPKVAEGTCRLGQRRHVKDARFARCLGRVAGAQKRFADATAYYADAIRLAPETRALYDEALEQLNLFIEAGLFEANAKHARDLARHADEILMEYNRRWPSSEPPVPSSRFDLLMGVMEMNAGNGKEATLRLERSVKADATVSSLMQLALLRRRLGRSLAAVETFERAKALTKAGSPEQAEVLEGLGDAHRESGSADKASAAYKEALAIWDQLATRINAASKSKAVSLVEMRRGVLHDRLGNTDESEKSFRSAIAAAPRSRGSYASVLSHLVISQQPNLKLATEVFRKAQSQVTLAPEWRVYFALWVKGIAARSSAEVEPEVDELLKNLSSEQSWFGRLASFGVNALPYEQLLASASNTGEQTEAHFYEGLRLISADASSSKRLMERTLSDQMMSFFEFTMARELLSH